MTSGIKDDLRKKDSGGLVKTTDSRVLKQMINTLKVA